MREIKFRAWDKTESRMFYPFEELVVDIDESHACLCLIQALNPHHIKFRDDDFILLQYTGLKDKNGKEIWEGDIVKIKNSVVGQIGWDYYAWQIVGGGMLNAFDSDDLEIIGNIWENSELLKNDK